MNVRESQSEHAALENAWRAATDRDIAEAIAHPEDLEVRALDIVRQEARRRGLQTIPTSDRPVEVSVTVGDIIVRLLQLSLRHRYVTAVIFSMGIVPIGTLFYALMPANPWILFIATNILFLGTIVALCWPLLSYKMACTIALLATLSRAAVGTTFAVIMEVYYLEDIMHSLPNLCGIFVAAFLITWGLLCIAIFIRRRYWPVYQEGQCAKCGYDLRGLIEPRCPECGTPFDSPVPAPADGQAITS